MTRISVDTDLAARRAFRINNFDLIRLFAAIQVAVLHGYDRFGQPFPAALEPLRWFSGVPIFFVISGFLISASLDRSHDLTTYARNRMLRIYPGLWACIVVTVAVAIGFGFGFGFGFGSLSAVVWFVLQLAGVIYTPGFLADFGTGTYNGSLWTIPIELQFYAVLPVLYWCIARRRNTTRDLVLVFLLFLGIGIAIRLAFPAIATDAESRAVKLLRYSFVPRFYLFMAGVVLQRLHVHASPYVRGRGLYWLAGFVAFKLIVPQGGVTYVVVELLLAVTIIALAYTAPTTADRMLRGNDISYGTYLYHGLVINIMAQAAFVPGPWAVPLVMAASIGLGFVSWRLVERPAMRTKRKVAPAPAAAV